MDTYYVRNINMGYYGRLPAGNLKQLAKEKKKEEKTILNRKQDIQRQRD